MKNINYTMLILLGFIIIVALSSCKKFNDANINTKANYTGDPSALFASATKNLVDIQASTNVNYNIFRLWAQYWNEKTYFDESNYNIVSRTIPQQWFSVVYNVLNLYQRAIDLENTTFNALPVAGQTSSLNSHTAKIAQIRIMEVYTYATMVELFGNVPCSYFPESHALQGSGNVYPVYIDAQKIYQALADTLITAVANLTNANSTGFAKSDLLYAGDIVKWQKFGNSLLFRMGMMANDVVGFKTASGKTATNLITQAFGTAGKNLFQNNADQCQLVYLTSPPNTNPLYTDLVLANRLDYGACTSFLSVTQNTNRDSRLSYFFKGAPPYVGTLAGATGTTASAPGTILENPTIPGVLLSYSEIQFLLAEAVVKGLIIATSTADVYYNNGIKVSADYWSNLVNKTNETSANVDNLQGIGTANVYTAFPASGVKEDKLKAIALQLWIALYNQGFEAWTQWRRLDYPQLPLAVSGTSIGNVTSIPKRFTYPVSEGNVNAENYKDAIQAVNGGSIDILTTRLFWDTKTNSLGVEGTKP